MGRERHEVERGTCPARPYEDYSAVLLGSDDLKEFDLEH